MHIEQSLLQSVSFARQYVSVQLLIIQVPIIVEHEKQGLLQL